MPLATGDKLGPYQILSVIGVGGMGEVYKARDTRLECTVAGSIELLLTKHSKPAVKQHLASIRMLFDWLVTGQVIPLNPVHSVRGPKHSVKKGKTSVLSAEEMGILLKSISVQDEKTGAPVLTGLRDRALIALMGYTFARVGAAVDMKVEDYYIQKRRGWVRLLKLKWRFRLNS
jgi:integrase/recombinase XerD